MIDARDFRIAGLVLLCLGLMTTGTGAHGAQAQENKVTTDHRSETADSPTAEGPSKPHVYFRPFCRRSRYVTDPSAPCWE